MWVIAETTELPTKFAKIVVTDDQGRFVIPRLCFASLTRPESSLDGGGKGAKPHAVDIQLRPNPLAKCRECRDNVGYQSTSGLSQARPKVLEPLRRRR